MYAAKWVKNTELYPTGKELSLGLFGETTDITSREGKSRHGQALSLNIGDPKMFPGGHIITSPSRGIALSSRIGRSRNYKWTFWIGELL